MRFMSLGGNCAGIACLGPTRERGPVDNWRVRHGLLSVISLFDGSFKKQVEEKAYTTKPRKAITKTDPGIWFIYSDYDCFHVDASKDEVCEKVYKRLDNLLTFAEEVKSKDDCYFVYFLSNCDVDKKRNMTENFINGLEKIQEFLPLEKIIFVGSKKVPGHRTYFDYYFNEKPQNIKYVELEDIVLVNDNKTTLTTARSQKNLADFTAAASAFC